MRVRVSPTALRDQQKRWSLFCLLPSLFLFLSLYVRPLSTSFHHSRRHSHVTVHRGAKFDTPKHSKESCARSFDVKRALGFAKQSNRREKSLMWFATQKHGHMLRSRTSGIFRSCQDGLTGYLVRIKPVPDQSWQQAARYPSA